MIILKQRGILIFFHKKFAYFDLNDFLFYNLMCIICKVTYKQYSVAKVDYRGAAVPNEIVI